MRQLWIGLVAVTAVEGSETLGDAVGAFVNALVLCESQDEFTELVARAVGELGLRVDSFEDVEPFRARLMRTSIAEELTSLARWVQETERPGFGVFHTFDEGASEAGSPVP